MTEAHRLTDICTGHGCYPPRPNADGSPDVYVNNLKWHRQTDPWNGHACPPSPSHTGRLSKGSSTVYVNNLQAGRIGDPVSCGSAAATGSPNVFAGG